MSNAIGNLWGENRILETVGSDRLLAERYSDLEDGGPRWFVINTIGNQRAIDIAVEVAKQGGVSGVFGINYTTDGYAAAVYTTAGSVAAICMEEEELLTGSQHVTAMGSRGVMFPMLGAWNWGKVYRQSDEAHDEAESPSEAAASGDEPQAKSKSLYWIAVRGPAATACPTTADEQMMRRADVHVAEQPGDVSNWGWGGTPFKSNYDMLFGCETRERRDELLASLMDPDQSVARRTARAALGDPRVVKVEGR